MERSSIQAFQRSNVQASLTAIRQFAGARKGLARHGTGAISVALFIVAWHLVAVGLASPYIPQPYAVAQALIRAFLEKDFLGFIISRHIVSSLLRIGQGFGLAVALAVPLGLASGWVRWVEGFTGPVIELIRPIPPLAWIPFAIYFFRDPFDAVFIVFLAAFFPVFLSTAAGVKAVDPILIDAARTLGARRVPLFAKVVVPAALSHIVTGMRIGLGIAWMSIVAAEMVGVKGGGLGVYIWTMAEVGRFDAVFAGMALIGLVGLGLTGGIGYVQRRLFAP
jgi:ABC-type nitrate/sulfonate/bicarbonate transport system permease component